MRTVPRPLSQLCGVLVFAHVALLLVGIYLQRSPLFSEGVKGIEARYVGGDIGRSFTGGIVESFGFLLLIPVLVFLARTYGQRSEAGRWAAQTGLMAGMGYVAVTFAVGFPAGAAAMYGAQHGLDVDTAFALNNVRIFAYFLSLLLLGGATLGIAISAMADGRDAGWVGRFGLATGAALLVSTPLAGIGQQDWGTLIWMVWFIGLGVRMLRHCEPAGVEESLPTVPDDAALRQS